MCARATALERLKAIARLGRGAKPRWWRARRCRDLQRQAGNDASRSLNRISTDVMTERAVVTTIQLFLVAALNTFYRAYGACMEGRGYTIE